MSDRLPISLDLHQRMLTVAKDFRKEPTPSERLLWQALRGRNLGVKFRRQQPIGPFVVDFFCAQHKLIIEVDGSIHATQVERDRERQLLLEACGYRVVRITAHDVEHNVTTVIERIREAISSSSPTTENGN